MNKEIIRKLIKIEMLKYEIIKDILPAKMLRGVNKFEKAIVTVACDIVLDFIGEPFEAGDEEIKKDVKKVKVDFL